MCNCRFVVQELPYVLELLLKTQPLSTFGDGVYFWRCEIVSIAIGSVCDNKSDIRIDLAWLRCSAQDIEQKYKSAPF